MSDLYLVLRHRLESVATDWIEIETDVLKGARKRKGWSYEAIARQIPIAAKTWERWEKAGRVPRFYLDKVADLIELEIEQPDHEPYRIAANGTGGTWQRELQDEIRRGFDDVTQRLDDQSALLRQIQLNRVSR